MGVGGHFWDLLKPYAKQEGFDFLRNKRVAVDLSYWIVQHETAIKGYTRKPHLRLTFFRTVNLFSKFGAFPVFVVDGTPSPLKSQARIARFFRASGIDLSSLPVAEEGVSVERNWEFQKCVRECMELLELLGMPVLKASGEAEALCAQLNREGHVDACITSDSDAFLFGAKCVIKSLQPNSKEPFEIYQMSDIEAGLGLKREHLVAISLLVGNDHDLNGVPGIGLDSALRFVKSFSGDEILHRLRELGRGDVQLLQADIKLHGDITSTDRNLQKAKVAHCSNCGHPGNKKAHFNFACEYCSSIAGKGCTRKPAGFKCMCSTCKLNRKEKELKKNENWQMKVCKKIALEQNFPNDEILSMYLVNNHGLDNENHLSWVNPKTELLADYLACHLRWEPSYTRQRMLPVLTTIFLRDMTRNRTSNLLCEQYEFDSVHRVKIRFGHQFYVINWKKVVPRMGNSIYTIPSEDPDSQPQSEEQDELADALEEPDVPHVHIENGCWYLLTDENMDLVRDAFPEKVSQFQKRKELKEMKSRRKKLGLISEGSHGNSDSPSPQSKQLSITEFYRSSKATCQIKPEDNAAVSTEACLDPPQSKRKETTPKFSKSARRRLLFG